MRAWPLWIGLLALAGAGFASGRAQEARLAALQKEVAALREAARRPATPPAPPRLLERLLAGAAETTAAATTTPPPPVAQAPGRVAAPAAPEAPATQEEHAARVESDFLGERVDPAWAPAVERTLGNDVAALGLDRRAVRSLECRQRTCRLETVHGTAAEGRGFLEEALRPGPRPFWTGPMLVEPAEELGDGRAVLVTYLLRD